MVVGIGDEQVASRVHCQAEHIGQLRSGGQSTIAGIAKRAVARHAGDDSIGRDLANAIVAVVRHEHITRIVHCHTWRKGTTVRSNIRGSRWIGAVEPKLRAGRRSTIARITSSAGSSDASNDAILT